MLATAPCTTRPDRSPSRGVAAATAGHPSMSGIDELGTVLVTGATGIVRWSTPTTFSHTAITHGNTSRRSA